MATSKKLVCLLTGNKCGFVAPDGRSNPVSGEGPAKARLVLVGESPGETELRVKRPFVGRAGQLLDDALKQANVQRSECYITNSCLCNKTPIRTPSASEWAACRERLISEIRSREPVVVVALGAVAMRSLLRGERRVKEARGEIVYSEEIAAYVIPTVHPAAVLRSPSLWNDFLHDLKKAADISVGCAKVSSLSPTYRVAREADDLTHLRDASALALDTEGEILCVGLSRDGQEVTIVPDDALCKPDVREALRHVLLSAETVVAHNLKYDWRVLVNVGILSQDERLPFEDTMLMAHTLDERRGTHSLKYLAREYLNVPDYSAEVRRYMDDGRLEECPRDILYRYNAMDVACTFHLHRKLEAALDKRQRNILDTLLYPASDALALMEHTGVLLDAEELARLDVELSAVLEDAVWQMHTLAGTEFNPNSWKQVADVLYERLALPVPYRYSTDAEALETLVRITNHPVPKLLLCYRKHHKTLGTYVRGLSAAIGPDGRVRTNFNLTGTETGRLSSSDPVNLQNIQRGNLRNIFIATPGYTLIEGDLEQAEVRAACWLARDEKLREILLSGEDIHTRTACLMFGKKPEEVSRELRTQAKRTTFGRNRPK